MDSPASVSPPAEWFAEWFDSDYYHRLYYAHGEAEAQDFLDRLIAWLRLKSGARVLDLACGRGRHSRYLRAQGFDVTGVDLSTRSIAYAQAQASDDAHLRFRRHDMREPLHEPGQYHVILNLFTSFGYFDSEAENVLVLRAAAEALRPGGELVIDYLNTSRVRQTLVAAEEKTAGGTTFRLRRRIHDGFFEKEIDFRDDAGRPHHFRERVQALSPTQLETYFALAGLRVRATFGDYTLAPYDADASPRLIYVVKK